VLTLFIINSNPETLHVVAVLLPVWCPDERTSVYYSAAVLTPYGDLWMLRRDPTELFRLAEESLDE